MPSFTEMKLYLLGLWLLVKGDRKGLDFVDFSDRGLMRSFWAILWCLPTILISWFWVRMAMMQAMPIGQAPGPIFFVRMGMLEMANWLIPLILAGALCWLIGLGRVFPAVVFTANWISVPFSYLYGVLSILLMVSHRMSGFVALVWLVAIIAMVVALSRIFRLIIGPQPLTVAAMTLALIIPSFVLSDFLERFLGVSLN